MRNPWQIGIAVISLLYLVCLSLFLCFEATFICDGYYPVGWSARGVLLHLAFWSPTVFVLAGCWIMAARPYHRKVSIPLLIGISAFTVEAVWTGFDSIVRGQVSHLTAVHLSAVALAYSSFAGIRKWAKLRSLGIPASTRESRPCGN